MKAKLPLRTLVVFGFLSATDLALTWYLLNQHDCVVYEANPLAGWLLARHGWGGLAVFKAAIVLVVGAVAVAIHIYRPRTGRRVLVFGCVVLAGVIAYSGRLAYAESVRTAPAGVDERFIEESNQ